MDQRLFILTGQVQIGKTRWLSQLIDELAVQGVPCDGVLAPGVWRQLKEGEEQPAAALRAGARQEDPFEKLGIDNVLLPQEQRLRFATRWDLAPEAGRTGGWVFHDDAVAQVDNHFAALLQQAEDAQWKGPERFLVVDELGWMELQKGIGLIHALEMLAKGPTLRYPRALIVVRQDLVPLAEQHFADAWSGIHCIAPNDEGRAALLDAHHRD